MTNTERGLSRRSFLSAATAVAASSALAGGVVLAGAPSAGAAEGADITWKISSEPESNMRDYADMLNTIRRRVSSHQVRPEGGRPVFVTDASGTSEFTTVDVHADNRDEFIRLYLRRSDAYFMGWRSGRETLGNITWGSFFTLDANVALPGAVRTGAGANVNTRYQGREGYTALGQWGATRNGMQLSAGSLSNAVINLSNGAGIDNGTAATAILQMIVGVSEASRFRNQAQATAAAFRTGQAYTVTPTHIEQHNNWGVMSAVLLGAILAGTLALSPELEIGGILYETSAALAAVVMLAHHSNKNSGGKKLEGSTALVAPDGTGDYWTVQDAVNAAPTYGANTIFIDKGVYHEIISVPSNKSWLTIQGVTGNASDVVIYNTRCHGMINPATGQKYGTQGSAVATFRPNNLVVKDLRIANTFDRNAHPEISPYETQAVAVVAMGDRQVYDNVEIWSHQDTLYVKGVTPTTQARQYFVGCHIRGDVDFIFGNATAVIALSTIQCLPWPNGTILAPSTDQENGRGILIHSCTIKTDGVPSDTMHLGRPWLNTETAYPRATVRNCEIGPGINADSPWIDMLPGQSWTYRTNFMQYQNFGPGTNNTPPMAASQEWNYTPQKFLAGSDGWDPITHGW